jgi:hypothetical protein
MKNAAAGAGVAVKGVDADGQADGTIFAGDVISHINGAVLVV